MWISKVRSVGTRVHYHGELSFQCKLENIYENTFSQLLILAE